MAQTTVTPSVLAKNVASATLAIGAGTAINAANTMLVEYPREGTLVLVINNTYAGAKVATIKAGDDAYVGSVLGDLDVSLAQDEVKYLQISSDRFKNSDGNVEIAFAASMTGFVRALQIIN